MRRQLSLLFVLVATACGTTSPPVSPPPITPVLTGHWAATAIGLEDDGVTCDLIGLELDLTQEAELLEGTHQGGTITCGPGTIGILLSPGTVSGTLFLGDSVLLKLSAPGRTLRGKVHGNGTITGTLAFRVPIGRQALILRGNWSAARG